MFPENTRNETHNIENMCNKTMHFHRIRESTVPPNIKPKQKTFTAVITVGAQKGSYGQTS